MPTSGTHITIVQRLAMSSPNLKALLGDPTADDKKPEGRKARFANLGTVGPDIFYAIATERGPRRSVVGRSIACVIDYKHDLEN